MKKTLFTMILVIIFVLTACGTDKPEPLDENIEVTDSEKNEGKTDENVDSGSSTQEETKEDEENEKQDEEEKVKAPDFTLSDGKGNEYTLSDLEGKIVFVNFWTTWCTYCEEEMPDFQKIYEKYKNEDIVILAVNVQTDPGEMPEADVLEWVEERGFTFPVLFDDVGIAQSQYYISAYPTTFIVDREGYVLGYIHATNEEMMEQIIESVK